MYKIDLDEQEIRQLKAVLEESQNSMLPAGLGDEDFDHAAVEMAWFIQVDILTKISEVMIKEHCHQQSEKILAVIREAD